MKFFWPIYGLSLFVGTAGVYVAAPYFRPYAARLLEKDPAATLVQPAEKPPAEAAASKPAAPRPAVTAPAAPAPRPAPAAEEDESPPAMQGVYLASHGDKPGWGITHQRTTYYKLDGSRMGTMPGGTLFELKKTVQSSKGVMLECVFLQGGPTNEASLVSRKDVYLFTATPSKLSKRQLGALQNYYAINGKIGSRKTELLQASASKNPHYAAANVAYRTYLAHVEKAKDLASQRDRATELDKSRLEDQLREMKVAEVKIKADLDAANLKFKTWKEQHASEIARPENDPDIKRWTTEMAALRRVVPGLAM